LLQPTLQTGEEQAEKHHQTADKIGDATIPENDADEEANVAIPKSALWLQTVSFPIT
jgi:hypothetical protein